MRYEERLGNCQGNYGQTRNHNAGNLELEDPNGVEKERGFSSAVGNFEMGMSAEKLKQDDVTNKIYLYPIVSRKLQPASRMKAFRKWREDRGVSRRWPNQ